MTTLQERVAAHFAESIRAKQEAEKVLVEPTVQAAELMLQCLMNDGKILACGNGGSAADAQHFAAEMTGRFEKERMELAAVALTTDTSALTAIGNDYGFDHVFSNEVRALGRCRRTYWSAFPPPAIPPTSSKPSKRHTNATCTSSP